MTEEIRAEPMAPAEDKAATPDMNDSSPLAESAKSAPEAKKAPAPRRLRLSELKPGSTVTGSVKNIADFGAFIDIGAEQDGLVHISELSENRVRRVDDVVKVGQAVEVYILDVDTNRRRISLSMKPREEAYEPDSRVVENDNEPTLTVMQLAFLKAQQKAEKAEKAAAKASAEKGRQTQEDILSRTLSQHRDRK